MNQSFVLDLLQQTMLLIVILSAPVLVVAMVVGITISLLQSVTQIQEATLTFVPKILTCFVTIIVLSPWMLTLYLDRTHKLLEHLAVITHH